MPCSSECNRDQISDALDGLLDGDELVMFHQHLERCASCSKAYEDLKQISFQLQTLPECRVPDDLVASVRKALQEEMTNQQRISRTNNWWSTYFLFPRSALVLAGAVCLVILLALWDPAHDPAPQPYLIALDLQTGEEVAGLDMELILSHEVTQAGQPVVPAGLENILVSSHTQGSIIKVSMASAQAIHPLGEARILELPVTHAGGSLSGTDHIQIQSIRAYSLDGKPAPVEIKATPMLSTPDGKLNTTA